MQNNAKSCKIVQNNAKKHVSEIKFLVFSAFFVGSYPPKVDKMSMKGWIVDAFRWKKVIFYDKSISETWFLALFCTILALFCIILHYFALFVHYFALFCIICALFSTILHYLFWKQASIIVYWNFVSDADFKRRRGC